MKKILTTIVMLVILYFSLNIAKAQPSNSLSSFSINFRFDKVEKNSVDSTFSLEYIFENLDFQKFSKIYFENSFERREIELVNKQRKNTSNINDLLKEQGIEVINKGNQTILLFKKYDKENLPVPVEVEDMQGRKKTLYHKYRNGRLQDAKSFRVEARQKIDPTYQ